ncbi:MAG: hypothetical protein JOZ75_02090 [Candidatus Dormibacteraeota bacterium]|nr:hypothetical protein [Candidatus Dormibacteraeota bacterium]
MGQTWNGSLAHDAGNVVADIGGFLSGPPGDPGRIRQCASQVESLRDRFDADRRAVNEAVAELTTTWTGAAGAAFHAAWNGDATGPARATVLDGAYRTLDQFARQLFDYADHLQHAQDEHWISMGIMAALTIVNVVQLGADPATDAAEVGVATGSGIGTSFALADIGTMAINGAAFGFSTDLVSQLGADLLDHLNPQFGRTGDHAVSLIDPSELVVSTVEGSAGGVAWGGASHMAGALLRGPAAGAAPIEPEPPAPPLSTAADDGPGLLFVSTPRGCTIPVPESFAFRTADNGQGIVYQEPTAVGNANMVRIMDPTPRYPDGYLRYYNDEGAGQPLDALGAPGSRAASHHALDGGPIPGYYKWLARFTQ